MNVSGKVELVRKKIYWKSQKMPKVRAIFPKLFFCNKKKVHRGSVWPRPLRGLNTLKRNNTNRTPMLTDSLTDTTSQDYFWKNHVFFPTKSYCFQNYREWPIKNGRYFKNQYKIEGWVQKKMMPIFEEISIQRI